MRREIEEAYLAALGSARHEVLIANAYFLPGRKIRQAMKADDGFAFDQLAVHRLEARSAVHNGRGNGALRKIGALQEGLLRRSFLKHGTYYDQVLWTILDSDWKHRYTSASETWH